MVPASGPTDANPIRREVVRSRAPESPEWRPAYDNGGSVRVANCPADLAPADPASRQPLILYYRHPSDPVGDATVRVLWEEPGWARTPRG
jgi:uncharacterized membrane protein